MHMLTVDEAVNDGANNDCLDHRDGLFPCQRQNGVDHQLPYARQVFVNVIVVPS